VQVKVEPAPGAPHVHPGLLVTLGVEIVEGRVMLSDVKPVLVPTPALLTVAVTEAVAPFTIELGEVLMATARSGPLTADATAVTELLPRFVSPPPETVDVEVMLVTLMPGFTVPDTRMSGYAAPPDNASERVQVKMAPGTGDPQVQPVADTDGP
jgi:hypothetical protein